MSDDVSCPAPARTLHLDFQNLADSRSSRRYRIILSDYCAELLLYYSGIACHSSLWDQGASAV